MLRVTNTLDHSSPTKDMALDVTIIYKGDTTMVIGMRASSMEAGKIIDRMITSIPALINLGSTMVKV